MLKLAGEFEVAREKIESLTYNPDVQGGTDLEAATKTITATAEATGVGNADYSSALTLPAPSDTRILIKQIGARLAVTIDSMTAGTLYCRVYVDAQEANNRLFDLSWTTAGAKLSATYVRSSSPPTIFNLLKDGGAHTFYFFFWVNSGNAVLSVVQLWEGVGTGNYTDFGVLECLSLTHAGLMMPMVNIARIGSGTASGREYGNATAPGIFGNAVYNIQDFTDKLLPSGLRIVDSWCVAIKVSVATDLVYVVGARFLLRSEV